MAKVKKSQLNNYKDYINNGLGDTFDLVPIAAFYG